MLTRQQKQQLRNLSKFKLFWNELNGTVMDITTEEPVHFPGTEEIRFHVFEQIFGFGFKSITALSSPKKANVILRIYSKRHWQYDYNEIHNLYGYYCFVRHWFSWITITPCGETLIYDAKKAPLRIWFHQDEYEDYDCDFVDFYLKIK